MEVGFGAFFSTPVHQHALAQLLSYPMSKKGHSPRYVRFTPVVSTGRRNTGGQLAINNDDGLPNARPIALSDSPLCQRSHNSVFSAAVKPRRYPCHIAKHSIFSAVS